MPIRTNRGRAAVYRRLWGWPMRSPRHLIATIAVFAIVVITIGIIVPRLTGSNDPARSPAAALADDATGAAGRSGGTNGGGGAGAPNRTTTPSPPPSSATTRLSGPTQTPTSAPPAPQALDVATQWAKAWVNHPQGVTSEQWLNGMRPFTTEEQIAVMASVDPANVPATAITGAAVPISSLTTSVEVKIPTNGGTLAITVISTPQGWRVAHYQQAA